MSEFLRTKLCIQNALKKEVFPGAVFGVYYLNSEKKNDVFSFGNQKKIPTVENMTDHTIFDLASLTKILGTTASVMRLIERGVLSWTTPVLKYFPQIKKKITVEQLLSHTSGLPAWYAFYDDFRSYFETDDLWNISRKEKSDFIRKCVFEKEFISDPGSTVLYSDLGFLILGFLIEEILETTLEDAFLDLVWKPMGIKGFHMNEIRDSVKNSIDPRYAATENCPWRKGVLQGQVHDDNTWAIGGIAGHAGVFGSVYDILKFCESIDKCFFSPKVLKESWKRMNFPRECVRARGWDTPFSGYGKSTGEFRSEKTRGHLGFTGTSLWIDPINQIAVTLLTNRVHPTRENDQIIAFRPLFHNAVYADLFPKFGKIYDRMTI